MAKAMVSDKGDAVWQTQDGIAEKMRYDEGDAV